MSGLQRAMALHRCVARRALPSMRPSQALLTRTPTPLHSSLAPSSPWKVHHRRFATESASASSSASSSSASDQEQPKRSRAEEFVAAAKRLKWYWKALIVLAEIAIVENLVDHFFLGGAEYRSIVASGTLARIALDYKLHYGPKCYLARHGDEDLHLRNAQRLCWMMRHNGGLYLKGGQALAMQGAVLPVEYQRLFGQLFDDASPVSWAQVKKVIEEDFGGRSVEDLFGIGEGEGMVEHAPRAAASIAQVHFARLPDGTGVAIKVQRRSIANEIAWDLWMVKKMFDYAAWSTALPVSKVGAFLEACVMQEVDFENEANNAEKLAAFAAADDRLRDSVHIPKVFRELSSKRVLTTEWVDGTQLWDIDHLTAPASAPAPGLGLKKGDIMGTVLELFSKQLFSWGLVHCDPHPGNILVRPHPKNPSKPQIVLLDHGLCVSLSPTFRRQYASFWKALVTSDTESLGRVARQWGLETPDVWAEASLMRPYEDQEEKKKKVHRTSVVATESEQLMNEETGAFLGDEDVFPRELLLLERVMVLLQGNNRFLGSPVSRINLMGMYAVKAVAENGGEDGGGNGLADGARTRIALSTLDMAIWWSSLRQYFGYGPGFEEEPEEVDERQMRGTKNIIAELLGIVVD